MCGIIGYVGTGEASKILLDGLSRLEYRGYDSAGVAILDQGKVKIRRALGKLHVLKDELSNAPLSGHLGIGHTRWATHGKPSQANAHPHLAGSTVVVHNGIIENYSELKGELQAKGRKFSSDTDTEVIAHLIDEYYGPKTTLLSAFLKTLKKVKGSYAIALLSQREPGKIYGARLGSPLILGLGDGENFIASDVPAVLPYTREAVFLKDGQVAELSAHTWKIYDLQGQVKRLKAKRIEWNLTSAEKGGYKHFMLKEIFEQPTSLADTLAGKVRHGSAPLFLGELDGMFKGKKGFREINKIHLIACGTSFHAALVGKFYLEQFLKIPAIVDFSSEFRYRDPPLDKQTLLIVISQSGETADSLVALKQAKKRGAKILSICNVVDSSIARESHGTVYTRCGPEIGVAATKTFTAQILVLLLIALKLGILSKKIKAGELSEVVKAMMRLPGQASEILQQVERIQEIALGAAYANHYLFVGRGFSYPIALEAALKLKEISYVHAEGYTAGELKHGPIALIDDGSPVIAFVSKNALYEKMMSNVEEVISRGASVIAIASKGDQEISKKAIDVIFLPSTHGLLTPILEAIPIQLFAYFIANHKGLDVDQPRNLAKSVTVE